MSNGPELIPLQTPKERNWLPMAIAAGVVILATTVVIFVMEHGKSSVKVTPIAAAPDPYAASLPLSNLVMSESGNLAGGKVTYLDGHIVNHGQRTINGISVQVLFRNPAQEVAQNETQPIKIIRMRIPYIDLAPISASPIKPGEERDFRLIFDAVNPDWDGAYPQVKIVHVDAQ